MKLTLALERVKNARDCLEIEQLFFGGFKRQSSTPPSGINLKLVMTSGRPSELSVHRLLDGLAVAAVCVFVFLAAYRIELPGLYYDELAFVNASLGAPDNTFVHLRLGPLPILLMPYLGALKAWIYVPIFHLAGVSPLTIRLPAILIAAVTLIVLYCAMRDSVGAAWAAIIVCVMAVDPANLFPSKLDWGPTVLMHFFQAIILALWFSYRKKPQLWKPVMIAVCFGLGFFDKFNFVWFLFAFAVGVALCYSNSLQILWSSLPRFVRWLAIIVTLAGFGFMAHLIVPLFYNLRQTDVHPASLAVHWHSLLSTLSGQAVAHFIFGNANGIIPYIPLSLIILDGWLALACLFLPSSNSVAWENQRNGVFCLLVGVLIFIQIAITPQAGGPHHYSMVFPMPLLAFGFFAASLYARAAIGTLRLARAAVFLSAAMCIFIVNSHNTAVYLSHFRRDLWYNPRWSPEIYALSRYVNEHGFEARRIICVDWGLHTQLYALAPRKLRRRMRDHWHTFKALGEKEQNEQAATLDRFFPEGKTLVLTFGASKEAFPETRRNFLASVIAHPQLKLQLVKEFWSEGEKIYELYEVVRLPHFVLQGIFRTGGIETGGGSFTVTNNIAHNHGVAGIWGRP